MSASYWTQWKATGLLWVASKRYGVPVKEITGRSRRKQVKDVRNDCIFIMREKFDMTYEHIGEVFCRSHSTVMHGYEATVEECRTNGERQERIERLYDEFVVTMSIDA